MKLNVLRKERGWIAYQDDTEQAAIARARTVGKDDESL